MPIAMFHLVYASTATKAFSSGELLELLKESREKNARREVTGFLLYKDASFLQALEGEESAVRELYAIIRDDPRHHSITTLVTIHVPARQFPDWSMGFRDLDNQDGPPIAGWEPTSEILRMTHEFPLGESVALGLLATFIKKA